MSSPLPCEPPPTQPSAPPAPHPDQRPVLTIVSAPDCEPPFDPDPFWARPRLRPVPDVPEPPADRASAADRPMPDDHRPGPAGATLATRRLVAAYLDALHGRRPAAQLVRLATADGADHLRRALSAPISPRRRIRLQSLHVAEPLPGVAEAVDTHRGERVLGGDGPAGASR